MRRALVLALLVCLPALASSVEPLSDEELVRRSDVIVHARVARVHVEWDSSHARLFTHVELDRKAALKGNVAAVVTLCIPGGSRDGMTTVIHGMPSFTEGEEVVV